MRAQLLDAPRPTDLVAVVRRLTLLQVDPTAAIAPSADLVTWSRLGASYQQAQLQQALEQDRTHFEHNAMVRPMSDLGLYLAAGPAGPAARLAARLLGADTSALLDNRIDGPVVPRPGSLLGAMFESLVTLSVRTYAQAAEAARADLHLPDRRGRVRGPAEQPAHAPDCDAEKIRLVLQLASSDEAEVLVNCNLTVRSVYSLIGS